MRSLRYGLAIAAALVLSCSVSHAQYVMSKVAIVNALIGNPVPQYFGIENVKRGGQKIVLTIFNTRAWITYFTADVVATKDLFENSGQTLGDLVVLRKTVSAGEKKLIVGHTTTVMHGDTPVTVVALDPGHQPPPGQPRSYFADSACVIGSAECDQAIKHAKSEKEVSLQDERQRLLGAWKGSYLCPTQDGLDVIMDKIDDDGTISALFSFYPIPGHKYPFQFLPGSYYLIGRFDKATNAITFKATDWKDKSQPGYLLNGFSAVLHVNRQEIVGKMDINGSCQGGRVFLRDTIIRQ